MTGGAILLAAGFSRRFGSDKRRHVLPDGTPLLLASLRLYAGAFGRLTVVLRPQDEPLARTVQDDGWGGAVQVVFCPEARHGMGHSLACGARAAGDWPYAFVALADMAGVLPRTLARLVETMENAGPPAVVQPLYRGTPGHPVGFGAEHLPALTTLTGDEGARRVLRAAGDALIRLEVDDPGVLEDLDTPPGQPEL